MKLGKKRKNKDVASVARKNYQVQSDLFSHAFVLYNTYTHLVSFGDKDILCAISGYYNYSLTKLRQGALNHSTQPPHSITFCLQQRTYREKGQHDCHMNPLPKSKTSHSVYDMSLLMQQSYSSHPLSRLS